MKRGRLWLNENFEKFNKVQLSIKGNISDLIGKQPPGINDPEYNNQENTDKAIGLQAETVN